MGGHVWGYTSAFEVQNFSLGGVAVKGTVPNENEMVIQLFDGDGSVSVPVVKMRSNNTYTGLKFSEMSRELRDFIGYRVYTEVLRKHQPTVLLFGTRSPKLMERQRRQLQKKYNCSVLATNSLLGLVEAIHQNRPPISLVVIGEHGFASTSNDVVEYLEYEQPNINWVVTSTTAGTEKAVERISAKNWNNLPQMSTD